MLDPSLVTDEPIAEQLPGELRRGPAGPLRFALAAVRQLALLVVAVALGVVGLPLFLLGRAVYGRPPNVIDVGAVPRYLGYIWARRATWSLPLHHRLWLSLRVLSKLAWVPVRGLAWFVDELVYGRRLDAVEVVEPLIVISAARSGSTQLARYLEDEPEIVAPTMIQCLFPYLWLWRLAGATLGRVLNKDAIDARAVAAIRPEFIERHEASLFRTDTFEGAFFLAHLNSLAPFLGLETFIEEFNLGQATAATRALWERDFVAYFDRVARKTLAWHGVDRSSAPRRLFIKGHFLAAAEALARRYPDGRFLTVIRHPSKRLESTVNFLRVNPLDATLGEPPWATIGPGIAQSEAHYCEVEQAWFGAETRAGPRRCVVRFGDYVRDLEGTLAKVYRECLDVDELPAHVPREHTPRRRKGYAVDRTLAQVGIDRAGLEARLAEYIAWSEGAGR